MDLDPSLRGGSGKIGRGGDQKNRLFFTSFLDDSRFGLIFPAFSRLVTPSDRPIRVSVRFRFGSVKLCFGSVSVSAKAPIPIFLSTRYKQLFLGGCVTACH